jgi:hypothetical protein
MDSRPTLLGLFRGDKPTYSPSQSCQFRATPCRDCDKIDRRNVFAPIAFDPFVSAHQIDRPMVRGRHEPGARVVRDSRLRPLLLRADQSILGEFLGDWDRAEVQRQIRSGERRHLSVATRVGRGGCVHERRSARSEVRLATSDTRCGVTECGADGPARRSNSMRRAWWTGPPPIPRRRPPRASTA